MPNEPAPPEEPRSKQAADGHDVSRDPDPREANQDAEHDDGSEGRRTAQIHDPESPGATIDTDHPAEPNEPA